MQSGSKPRRPSKTGQNPRHWAEANGLSVKARGALPNSVIEKYKAALTRSLRECEAAQANC